MNKINIFRQSNDIEKRISIHTKLFSCLSALPQHSESNIFLSDTQQIASVRTHFSKNYYVLCVCVLLCVAHLCVLLCVDQPVSSRRA